MSINLDSNATYGLLPEVKEAILSFLDNPAFSIHLNPSSVHLGGQNAKNLIEEAREEISLLIGCNKEDKIIFTSGATEANNLALRGILQQKGGGHLVTSAIEHPSILETAEDLRSYGVTVDSIGVDPEGVLKGVKSNTNLLSVMYANNETGYIFPVYEMTRAARVISPKILIHTDAVQALGKIPFSWNDLGVDLMSISGHKIGALSGVGALIIKEDCAEHLASIMRGGPQENKLRAGTENILGIYSFGVAAGIIRHILEDRIQQMTANRLLLKNMLTELVPEITLLGDDKNSLPNTISVRFKGVNADDLVVALDLEGILVSSGAACSSGKPTPSHVLLALGLKESEAREVIRISVKAEESPKKLEWVGNIIAKVIKNIRASQ